MYYIGWLAEDLNRMMLFWADGKPTRKQFPYLGKVTGPYGSEQDARNTMAVLHRAYNYVIANPAKSERQRRFMCMELGRKRVGKRTKTKMTEKQLKDFCKYKKNHHLDKTEDRIRYIVKTLKFLGESKENIRQYVLNLKTENQVKEAYLALEECVRGIEE